MRRVFYISLMFVLTATFSWASQWEKRDNFYYLTKNTKDSFSASAPGANNFATKYLTYEKIDFLVKGAQDWKDYGRLYLGGNNMFSLPIHSGVKIDELHFLAGGNFSNSYKSDALLKLYGDNYYYATVTVIFAYQDGSFRSVSVPVFWDWFHLGSGEWVKDGGRIKSLGDNPMRPNCNLYHMSFMNPKPFSPLKNVLVTDSWVADIPFSDIFAVTIKSSDSIEASPKTDK